MSQSGCGRIGCGGCHLLCGFGGHDYFPSRMGRTLCDYVNGTLKAYIEGGFEFVSTRDIVSGHLLAMHKGRTGHKYIFGTEFLTLEEILSLFEEASGVKRSLLRIPGPLMYGFSEIASLYLSHFHPHHHQRLTPGAIRLLRMRRSANKSKAIKDWATGRPISGQRSMRLTPSISTAARLETAMRVTPH